MDFAATGFHPLKLDDDDTITCTQDCNVTFLAVGDYGFYCENHGSAGGNGMCQGFFVHSPDKAWLDCVQALEQSQTHMDLGRRVAA